MLAQQLLKFIAFSVLLMVIPRQGHALSVDGGLLGIVEVTPPVAESKGLVFLLGEDQAAVASSLAADGLIVARIDTARYLRTLRGVVSDCLYLVSDIEETSRRIQRQLAQKAYFSPWVLGTNATGSALAYGMLAQAPAATLAGAVMMAHADYIDTPLPLCPGARATAVAAGGYRYAPRQRVPGLLLAAPAPADRVSRQAAFLEAITGAQPPIHVAPTGPLAPRAEAAMVAAMDALHGGDGDLADLRDLPLHILPGHDHGPVMAVVYSGDGGWRDIDKQLAAVLAKEGIPVVGVDALRYFWDEKTPEQMARDFERIVAGYGEHWRTPQVAIIGYSFGADILPYLYNALTDDTKAQVKLMSLLALATHGNFSIAVTGWLGEAGSPDKPTAVPLAKIPKAIIQCIRGTDEEDSGCADPVLQGAEVITIEGGHHFDGDYVALAHRIRAAIEARTVP